MDNAPVRKRNSANHRTYELQLLSTLLSRVGIDLHFRFGLNMRRNRGTVNVRVHKTQMLNLLVFFLEIGDFNYNLILLILVPFVSPTKLK